MIIQLPVSQKKGEKDMSVKINCLNPIAACGMELLPDTYEVTDNFAEADAVLVMKCIHA